MVDNSLKTLAIFSYTYIFSSLRHYGEYTVKIIEGF